MSGFHTPGDGGGGKFQALTCNPTTTGTLISGTNVVSGVGSTAGVYVGQPIGASGIPLGTTVSAVSSESDQLWISNNATATAPVTLTFTNADNGGTIIQNTSSQCFYRTDYRGDPHEWGAYGANGSNDDTTALKNWLNWTPGPWNAIIPSNYQVTNSLTCWPDTTIMGPANQVGQNNPPVRIFASVPQGSRYFPANALILAQSYCRISGITIDANSVPTSSSTFADGIDVQGSGVVVDGFSAVENGNYNINCTGIEGSTVNGLIVKDTQIKTSVLANVNLPSTCNNVRLIGDVISGGGSGASGLTNEPGVSFAGTDLTLADGIIEASTGDGLYLSQSSQISVTGEAFTSNGTVAPNGGAAIHLNSDATVSICGNHFNGNNGGKRTGGQVFFEGQSTGVSFCGNSYIFKSATPNYPNFVYDAAGSTTLPSSSFYENPAVQALGITSPAAAVAGIVPTSQVLPAPKSYLTGLVLSNDATATTVDIAAGSATDSTGTMVISLTSIGTSPACKIDLTPTGSGLGHLDTSGGSNPNTTYFFFAVADLSGEAPPNCIASANLTPTMNSTNVPSYGTPVYRLIGALYTTGSNAVVPFTQDGDSFYLTTPVTDINSSIGPTSLSFPLSVPCGRNVATCSGGFKVEAFGRIVGGSGYVLVFSPDEVPPAPNAFPGPPGYSTKSAGPDTSFPFRLETDANGKVSVQASVTSTAAEVTDGWVFYRQQ